MKYSGISYVVFFFENMMLIFWRRNHAKCGFHDNLIFQQDQGISLNLRNTCRSWQFHSRNVSCERKSSHIVRFFLPGQSNVEFTSYSISFNSSDLTRPPKCPNTHYFQNLIERGSVAYLTMIFRCALKQWKFCALLRALTVSFSSYLKGWWGGCFR